MLHRVQGDNATAERAANEALDIHAGEPPSRFRNRIDPDFEIAAVLAACHTVLGVIAVENGEPERGARRRDCLLLHRERPLARAE